MNTNNKTYGQFPILGILGLIFITLKLTGHIAWSWWWVLAPFWIPITIVVFGLVLIGAANYKWGK
jgi:hypothetical protein